MDSKPSAVVKLFLSPEGLGDGPGLVECSIATRDRWLPSTIDISLPDLGDVRWVELPSGHMTSNVLRYDDGDSGSQFARATIVYRREASGEGATCMATVIVQAWSLITPGHDWGRFSYQSIDITLMDIRCADLAKRTGWVAVNDRFCTTANGEQAPGNCDGHLCMIPVIWDPPQQSRP